MACISPQKVSGIWIRNSCSCLVLSSKDIKNKEDISNWWVKKTLENFKSSVQNTCACACACVCVCVCVCVRARARVRVRENKQNLPLKIKLWTNFQ